MTTAADGSVVISTALDNSGMEKDVKKTVAKLAAQYRKAGMSQSDAMKKAWAETEHTSAKSSKKVNRHIQSMGKSARKVTGDFGGLSAVLGKLGAAIGAAFAAQRLVQFGKASVQAARELSDALTGLQSIMDGQGRSFAQAKDFIDDYTKDGLVPATNAITAYKNLALRGYDDSQIRQVMVALKDSAAFGRQASYSMGEAVQSATEGLKNENSILVDNAGVTKNVAQMWNDYARSIGTTANNLTQQQKIQAEVNGILEESKYQTGDAAKVAGTFSGQLMQLSFNFNSLKVAVGNAIIPVAQRILPVINAIIAGLTRLASAVAVVMGAIFGKAKVQAKAASAVAQTTQSSQALAQQNDHVAASAGDGAAAENKLAASTKKAGKAAKGALASFDDLNVLQQSTADSADDGGHGGRRGGRGEKSPGPAAGTGIAPIAAEMDVEDELSPRMQAIVDKVHELLKPLQEINFGPLIASFDRLKKAIAPLTKQLFAGLEWAWYNIFVPLAAWTIEDLLPAFLDTLAGVCDVLSAALEALAPLGQWLWESFLQPIASWTGGLIVTVLQNLADGLDRLADWIRDNQGAVETMAVLIGGLAVAFGLVKIALAGLEIVGLLMIAMGGPAAAAVGAVDTAMTLLNAHMLVITLVIGALIAIIVLLVMHWDEVKEVALNVWTKIKEVWGKVCTWFTEHVITPLSEAWESFKEGFLELWNGITDGIKGAINSIIGFINGMISAVVSGLNWMIEKINGLSFSIPDWVPEVGGQTFGFSIPKITAPQIPMLAQGAVLPANRPFLAMVGDQKNGTNIEAPLDTIKQALAEVLGQQRAQEIVIKFAASGGLEQLIRLLKPYIDRENNRVGPKLIEGGGY